MMVFLPQAYLHKAFLDDWGRCFLPIQNVLKIYDNEELTYRRYRRNVVVAVLFIACVFTVFVVGVSIALIAFLCVKLR